MRGKTVDCGVVCSCFDFRFASYGEPFDENVKRFFAKRKSVVFPIWTVGIMQIEKCGIFTLEGCENLC